MRVNTIGLSALILVAMPAQGLASEWVRDVEVTQLGAYQEATHHFVWFGSLSQECNNSPTMYFDDTKIGGKALLAMLMTALINKRKVDYQAAGCEIAEVYLK